MNRNSAKILTTTGIFCCLISVLYFVLYFNLLTNFTTLLSSVLFIGGIIQIAVSLAFYTEI